MTEVSSDHEAAETGAEPADGSTAEGESVSLDVMFEVLKNSRRRMVLDYLEGREGQVKLSELADQVTAAENETDVDSITSTERKRVYVGLYQFHLPKMDDMGIIEFDQDRGSVELTERGNQLLRAHERNSRPGRKWHVYSFGLGAIGLVAAAGTYVMGSTLLPVVLLTLQSLALFAFALVQTREYHDGFPRPFDRQRDQFGRRFLRNDGGQ